MRLPRRTEAAACDAPWQPRRRPALLAAVLLGHGLLLLGWRLALAPHATPPAATGPAAPPLVWLSLAAAPAPVAPRPTTEPAPNPRAAPRASRPISPDLPARTTDLTVIPPTASSGLPVNRSRYVIAWPMGLNRSTGIRIDALLPAIRA